MGKLLDIGAEIGGFPWSNESFAFLQDAAREQLSDVAQGFASDVVLLYGLEPILTELTSGAILYQGEIYRIDQATAPAPADTLHIDTTFDPVLDPTTFKDLSAKNVHKIRKMSFAPVGGGNDTGLTLGNVELLRPNVLLSSNGLLDELYKDLRWAPLTLSTGYSEDEPLELRKEGETIRMRGKVNYSAAVGSQLASGIPANMAPSSNKIVSVDLYDAAGVIMRQRAHVVVTTGGNIDFSDVTYSSIIATDQIFFDGSFYRL